mgnify:CR=1 FL=1
MYISPFGNHKTYEWKITNIIIYLFDKKTNWKYVAKILDNCLLIEKIGMLSNTIYND